MSIGRALLIALVISAVVPGTAFAQETKGHKRGVPIVFANVGYDKVLRQTFGARLLIPRSVGDIPGGWDASGLFITAAAGQAGYKYGVGRGGFQTNGPHAFLGSFIASDASVIVTRTSDNPRRGSPHSTYVGGEIGMTLAVIRLSFGVQRRVRGAGNDRTFIPWSVGAEFVLHR